MGHHEHLDGGPMVILALVLSGIAAIAAIVWWLFFRSRGDTPTDHTTPMTPPEQVEPPERPAPVAQKTTAELSPEEEILKLLRQKGRPMTQDEINEALPLISAQEIAFHLESLEKSRSIERNWHPTDQVFVIGIPADS